MSEQTPAYVPKKTEPNITEVVLQRVHQFQKLAEISIPKDYSPKNALKSAYLILSEQTDNSGKPVLQSCSRESIANALLNMVVQGLSPMKKQGAFVPYNGKLQWQTEYHGNIALAKRYGGVREVAANVIYEGDVFEYVINAKTGRKEIIKHEQKFENIDINKIKGAYAVLVLQDGSTFVEVMNMIQIQTSWNQGASKGNSPAHRNFKDEMAKKTVINRACKLYISTSSDANILETEETETVDTPAMVIDDKEPSTVSFDDTPTEEPEPVPSQPAQESKSNPDF